MANEDLKVALVYDWVDTTFGGAEKVLQNLHQIFPQAPLYTSIYNSQKANWAKSLNIKTTFLQKLPHFFCNHKILALLLPIAFESLDFSDFDLIISVSSGPAKGIITKADQLHINYCLTPPRYLYTHKKRYLDDFKLAKLPLVNKLIAWNLEYLKWWDLAAGSRPDVYIPISEVVADRIRQIYNRQVERVVYPPVGSVRFSGLSHQTRDTQDDRSGINSFPDLSINGYYLVVSRLVPYKKIDVAIRACEKLDKKLIIVGEGEDKSRLQSVSKSDMTIFAGNLSDKDVAHLYQGATGLLMVGEEDFGITGLEALSTGIPVVVNKSSGVAELIIDGKHGVHLNDESVQSLIEAIKKLEKIKFNKKELKNQATDYTSEKFKKRFSQMSMMLYDRWS